MKNFLCATKNYRHSRLRGNDDGYVMKNCLQKLRRDSLMLFACGTGIISCAFAAPLDAFLSANQSSTPGEVQIEASYDIVNSTVDVFGIRDNDANFSGTNIGDYHGGHVRAGVAVTPSFWLDGAFWQRRIDYRSDAAKINTWQLAGQYKLMEGAGYHPSIALRVGAWGNYADELKKSSATTFNGTTLNSVTVSDPKDVQYQLDLIGTSKILESTELTLFAGVGTSRTTLSSVSGTMTQNGCDYKLAFDPTEVVGTLAQPCNGSVIVDRFTIPNSALGVDINNESQYSANYYHGGLNLKWTKADWQLRGGYQYQYIKRSHIDDIIKSRGGTPYQSNHILMGEIAYKPLDNIAIFMRGQYMSNQFTGEIPFAYNTLTASRFDKRYGIVSTGLVVTF